MHLSVWNLEHVLPCQSGSLWQVRPIMTSLVLMIDNHPAPQEICRCVLVVIKHDKITTSISAHPTSGGPYFWAAMLSKREWAPLASWITGIETNFHPIVNSE